MVKKCFLPADILLPQTDDLSKWSVVACDQYTSEPEYWERVRHTVGANPSTYNLVLPEIYLSEPDVDRRVARINETMHDYLNREIFKTCPDCYIYLQRTVSSGKIRHGLVGRVDLEGYSYGKGSQSPIRPTEGTVEDRLPPRIRVRQDAPLELPHIMLLIDDMQKQVIEPLSGKTAQMAPAYDFELMEGGGHIRGWVVSGELKVQVDAAIDALFTKLSREQKLPEGKKPLLIAVGDGNHSLATAKACYENLKKTVPQPVWESHPARYALAELGNVHDDALEFEPIHRVLFEVDPQAVIKALYQYYDVSETECTGQSFTIVNGDQKKKIWIKNPSSQLAVGTLQQFIDTYLSQNPGTVDYIHGDDVVSRLSQKPDSLGFLLPGMEKSQLFETVIVDGALPRKTFSMGHAFEKRFYLECRKIR